MFEDGIQDDQQFAHTGNQSNFWFFARCPQPSVEVSDHGIAPAGSQRSHVEGSAHVSSTTPNDTASPQQTTVPVEWGHTDKRSDLFAVQAAQLGQLGQHGAADDGPDTRHTLKEPLNKYRL